MFILSKRYHADVMEYNDVLYGAINIPKHISSIIATPQFQRLKKVKQLGLLYKQIPGAKHTRFEHCIGTYHQARRMLSKIEQNTQWITVIPINYKNAIEIAALLHDVGHGPFSHTWEHIGVGFCHEENAMHCIDEIFERCVHEFHEDNEYQIELVKAFILGDSMRLSRPVPAQYNFLFEIVNNKQCKLDVDKWDYLKRDHHYLQHIIDPNIAFDDVFLEARASKNGAHIEYQYKDYEKIYNIFEARAAFHIYCYQIPRNIAYEQILRYIIGQNSTKDINGLGITEISSYNKIEFLELTDEMVLELIQYSAVFTQCFTSNRLVEIFPATEEEKENIPGFFKVNVRIKYAGEEMPDDTKFSFYGSVSDKPFVKRKRGFYESTSYFALEKM